MIFRCHSNANNITSIIDVIFIHFMSHLNVVFIMIPSQRLQKIIQQGMFAYENDIQNRREILRRILLDEEAKLSAEINELNEQKKINNDNDEEYKIQSVEKNIVSLKMKKNQQHTDNCAESRANFTKEINRGLRYCQRIQILEKKNNLNKNNKNNY